MNLVYFSPLFFPFSFLLKSLSSLNTSNGFLSLNICSEIRVCSYYDYSSFKKPKKICEGQAGAAVTHSEVTVHAVSQLGCIS